MQWSWQLSSGALSGIIALVVSRPDQFPWLMLGSLGMVATAAGVYTLAQPRNTDRYRAGKDSTDEAEAEGAALVSTRPGRSDQ